MQEHRSWVEIDQSAIRENVAYFRSLLNSGTEFLGMVKSNAYGHGLVPFSEVLVDAGIDWLGVDAIEEAFALRDSGIDIPILVVGYTLPVHFPQAAARDITLTISSLESLAHIAEEKTPPRIHIKLETGLGRQGILWDDRTELLSLLGKLPEGTLTGIFSHLAAAESPEYRKHTTGQKEKLSAWRTFFSEAGYTPQVHLAASAATVLYPDFHLDIARVGISLYGLWPSEDVFETYDGKFDDIRPVLTWKSIISEYKHLPEGMRLGYDLTESLGRDSIVGIVPVGYWHGYPRHLSSVGEVLVSGKRAKVLGRVCMDMIIVDLTDIPAVSVGDEVVLLGKQEGAVISAEELAQRAGTINYEIVTRINQDIPRLYR